jgi:hypothetical protein
MPSETRWITPTAADLLRACSSPEREALAEAAIAPGQGDPVPETLADAVAHVRDCVASFSRNRLGGEGMVPRGLLGTTLSLGIYTALSRLPIASLITEARTRLYDDALDRLKLIAAGDITVEQPDLPLGCADFHYTNTARPRWRSIPRRFTRAHEEGL